METEAIHELDLPPAPPGGGVRPVPAQSPALAAARTWAPGRTVGLVLWVAAVVVLLVAPWLYGRYLDLSPEGRRIRALEARLAAKPGDVNAYLQLARLYEGKGFYGRARILLEKARARFPNRPEVSTALAEVLLLERRYGASILEARAALAASPDDGLAYYILGMAYGEEGRWDEAAAALRRASGYWPSSPVVLEALAVALARAGNDKEAEAARRQADLLRLEQDRARVKKADPNTYALQSAFQRVSWTRHAESGAGGQGGEGKR